MAKNCFICKSSDVNDLELGEFLDYEDVQVHYFCLLLTTSLQQNGEDDEGLLGFLIKDVKQCVRRIKKNICYVCHKPYANIECSKSKCSRKFHTLCGLKHCLNTFSEKYISFCENHHHLSTNYVHNETEICLICYDAMGPFNPVTSIQPICCKSGWMHKRCVAHYAKNSGYFCKCPLCNNDEKFRNFIAHRGIYIPDQDAAWEMEPNAYSELLERPEICQATNCCCSSRTVRNFRNKMKTCTACGSYIAHLKCWFGTNHVLNVARNFICNNCTVINNQNENLAEVKLNQTIEDMEQISDDNDNNKSKVNERCNRYLKRTRSQIILLDSDSSDTEVKELRGRKIRLNTKKESDEQSEIIRSHDGSSFSSASDYSSINSKKSLDHQNIDKNPSIVKRRKQQTIKDDDIDWDEHEYVKNSNKKPDIRKLNERKIKIKMGTNFNMQSESTRSLDSYFNSSSDCPIQSTSDVNRKKKRIRITMNDDDSDDESCSNYSDYDNWSLSTIKRRFSRRINTSGYRPRSRPAKESYGILSDISNDNGNSSNSIAEIIRGTSQKNSGDDSLRSRKPHKRQIMNQSENVIRASNDQVKLLSNRTKKSVDLYNEADNLILKMLNKKSDGLNQTKIDMYFKTLPY